MTRSFRPHTARLVLAILLPIMLAACSTLPESAAPRDVIVAQQAYKRLANAPDDAVAVREYQSSLRLLARWLEGQPDGRQAEALASVGLRLDDSDLDDAGLHFRTAERVSTRRLERRYTREGIGVALVAWRRNDGSGQWDDFRPVAGGINAGTSRIIGNLHARD